jgi:hypothetical protein
MASQQEQCRKGDAAQEKVTTQDPPRSGLVLRAEVFKLMKLFFWIDGRYVHQEISMYASARIW